MHSTEEKHIEKYIYNEHSLKLEYVENGLKMLLKKEIDICVSIIVLSLISNLLFVGKTIPYKIQVLSLSLLKKRV